MSNLDFYSTDSGLYDRARARAMTAGYFDRYSKDKENYFTVSVEEVFDITEGGVRFGGKIDTLLRRKSDNRLIHMEHKTSGWAKVLDETSDYWTNLFINRQIALYSFAIAKKYGEMPLTIWDVVYKPRLDILGSKVRQRKTETELEFKTRRSLGLESPEAYENRLREEYRANPKYFIRREINLLDDDIQALVDESHFTSLRINAVMNWKDGYTREDIQWARNPVACMSNWGTCPFLQTCSGFASLENNSKLEKLETPHPELEVEKDEKDEWKL